MKKVSSEKFGFQKFLARPKPNKSGHGYSFQLAKTHCEQVSKNASRASERGNLHLGRILTDMRKTYGYVSKRSRRGTRWRSVLTHALR